MERKKLLLLNPNEYEHELDKKALNSLKKTPGLDKLTKAYYKHTTEQTLKILKTGSSIKVTHNNHSEIKELLEEACANLHFKNIPELYIEKADDINVTTMGITEPLINITSEAVENLTPDELINILGQGIGHIKSGHVIYQEMTKIVPYIGDAIGLLTLGFGELISKPLELSLLYWYRVSQLTADRAGLLACQDYDTSIRTLIKISGIPQKLYNEINTEEFINQAKEFENYDFDALNKLAKTVLITDQSQSWAVLRASELIKWVESKEYQKIIDKHANSNKLKCKNCDFPLDGMKNFCGNCGEKLWKR